MVSLIQSMKLNTFVNTSGYPLAHGLPKDTIPTCTLSTVNGPPESPCEGTFIVPVFFSLQKKRFFLFNLYELFSETHVASAFADLRQSTDVRGGHYRMISVALFLRYNVQVDVLEFIGQRTSELLKKNGNFHEFFQKNRFFSVF